MDTVRLRKELLSVVKLRTNELISNTSSLKEAKIESLNNHLNIGLTQSCPYRLILERLIWEMVYWEIKSKIKSEVTKMDKLKAEFERAVEQRMEEIKSGSSTSDGEIRRSILISAIDEEARLRLNNAEKILKR
jgi:hypothetical protein